MYLRVISWSESTPLRAGYSWRDSGTLESSRNDRHAPMVSSHAHAIRFRFQSRTHDKPLRSGCALRLAGRSVPLFRQRQREPSHSSPIFVPSSGSRSSELESLRFAPDLERVRDSCATQPPRRTGSGPREPWRLLESGCSSASGPGLSLRGFADPRINPRLPRPAAGRTWCCKSKTTGKPEIPRPLTDVHYTAE